MAKLVHISREKIEEGCNKLEQLLAEDASWQVEYNRIKQFEAEEKARRDAEYAKKQKEAPK